MRVPVSNSFRIYGTRREYDAEVISSQTLPISIIPRKWCSITSVEWRIIRRDDEDHALNEFRLGVAQVNEQSTQADLVSDLYAVMGDILYKKGQNG